MSSQVHDLIDWVFDKPLRSGYLDRLAGAYRRVYKHGRVDRSDIHTNGELRLLQRVAEETGLAFDVGANQGEWTAAVLNLRPSAEVHAFEPVASTRAAFAENDFPDSVRLNPFGLSNEPSTSEIYNYGSGGGLNSIYRRTDLEARNAGLRPEIEEIRLETLDQYAAEQGVEKIDFLKIDVEGHELSVLKGATQMLAEGRIRRIQIEYGTSFHFANTLLRDVFDMLAPIGMTGGQIESDRIIRQDQYTTRLETFGMSNWVFARPDDALVWD